MQVGLLLAENAKMIVVACNSASALAIPRLEEMLKIPVIGVIMPGAKAACEAHSRVAAVRMARSIVGPFFSAIA